MDITPFNSNTYDAMGGRYPERVALGLSVEMLEQLRIEAKSHGRSLLAQIRFFCEQGLKQSRDMIYLDERLAKVEQRLMIAEETIAYSKPRAPSKQK